jgi:DNA-binding MarR family transcriptional regulator
MPKAQADPEVASALALAGELRVVLSKLSRRLREQAHAADLTGSQKSVLLRLERDGPATVTALARAEGVRSQSMGATISSLEEAGHVIGSPDPADRRQTILSITGACREWIRAAREAKEDWLFRALRAKLAPREQEQLAGTIELLRRLADA